MNADVTLTRADENAIKIRVAVLLAGIVVAAMLIIGAWIIGGGQGRETQSRLTIDRIDPCSPYLLGSQLSPYEQMELEERCAQQESAIPMP